MITKMHFFAKTPFILMSLASIHLNARAENLKEVYVDRKNNIHIVDSSGKGRQLTHMGNAKNPKLAPDKQTVAWLIMYNWTAEGDEEPGSGELAIYRHGKIRSLKCEPFIRDYWFWRNGKEVAMDCGGRHFVVNKILYDVQSRKQISSFHERDIPLENRPNWSIADE